MDNEAYTDGHPSCWDAGDVGSHVHRLTISCDAHIFYAADHAWRSTHRSSSGHPSK